MDPISIDEVFYLLEADYNEGGVLHERPRNRYGDRPLMSVGFQLKRMDFTPRPGLCYRTLSPEQQEYYDAQVRQMGLPAYWGD